MKRMLLTTLVFCLGWFSAVAQSRPQEDIAAFVRANYTKQELYITMRDGVRLFTSIYTPKDAGPDKKYPIMLNRTCYSVGPYGENAYRGGNLGPSETMVREKYIFVFQDVRGRYMSEGTWTNMTPHIPNKTSKDQVDESSDTWDTIDWLTQNLPHNNGKVGQWGISYPGFYTTAGAVEAHAALKASSPQAPIADFFFDDFHHNGAYTLGYFWNTPLFGIQKTGPTSKDWFSFFDRPTPDGYDFFLKLGSLKNASKYYGPENFFWQELSSHPNYDEFWQKRNILQHLNNVNHAIMVVGGWFDAEDLYGPLETYKTIERNNPNAYNTIVMGPFGHGDWARERGNTMHHQVYFGDSIATFYQKEIEAQFFYHFLKGDAQGKPALPEAYMFNTGKKAWEQFEAWPPRNRKQTSLYFHPNQQLSTSPPATDAVAEFVSDPAKPVPYTQDIPGSFQITPRNYMSEDQRFAASRPDVLVFQTEPLEADMTLSGELLAKLFVSTTGTDADWVVKLIDVYPGDTPNDRYTPAHVALGGYQQMVRSEIMRSRFRNGFEQPEPMVPQKVTPIEFRLQDVNHTFKKGHRVMVQIQSTWFPLFDRNPQKFVPNIFEAADSDFIKATHKVFMAPNTPSQLVVDLLEP